MTTPLPPFLRFEPGTDFVRLEGSRIGLTHVVRLYAEGMTAEMILLQFPTLSLPLIYKVLAFYLENQAEVDAYVAEDTAELRRQEAECDKEHRAPSLDELRGRFERLYPGRLSNAPDHLVVTAVASEPSDRQGEVSFVP